MKTIMITRPFGLVYLRCGRSVDRHKFVNVCTADRAALGRSVGRPHSLSTFHFVGRRLPGVVATRRRSSLSTTGVDCKDTDRRRSAVRRVWECGA